MMDKEEIERLQRELNAHMGDVLELEREKQKKKADMAGLEARIRKLKESGAVPKQIWQAENALARATRERNMLAERLSRIQAENRRMRTNLLEKRQEYLMHELGPKRPRKIRRH